MAERTLPEPLEGPEVINAFLDAIRGVLERDCYLGPGTAYRWFDAEFTYKIRVDDAPGITEIKRTQQVVFGEAPEVLPDAMEGEMTIEPAEPNVVRQESGQPIPTLTKDENGKTVIKKVSYAKKPRATAKA